MKYLIPIALLFIMTSCQKTDYKHTGKITGEDFRECVCCGGYFIEIKNELYNFSKLGLPPNNLDLPNATFPVLVKLNFETNTHTCPNIIGITALKKQ